MYTNYDLIARHNVQQQKAQREKIKIREQGITNRIQLIFISWNAFKSSLVKLLTKILSKVFRLNPGRIYIKLKPKFDF